MRIVFVASEVVPFAKTGGLADVAGALPRALAARGHKVMVFFPRYRQVNAMKAGMKPAGKFVTVTVGRAKHRAAFWRGPLGPEGAEAVAVDIPALYDRFGGLYGPPGADFPDNAERYLCLSRAAIERVRADGEVPDVFHAHDWHAGMLPVLLREAYGDDPQLAKAATVFTVHNMAYQGGFEKDVLTLAGLSDSLFRKDKLDHFGRVSFLHAGLRYADRINTVSARYRDETIESDEFGRGMQFVLRERKDRYSGILNGIDLDAWDPKSDPHLPRGIAYDDPAGKAASKAAVQKELGLALEPDAPLIGIVSRLDPQKGLDLVHAALPQLLADGCQLALLGAGDPVLERAFKTAAKENAGRVGVGLGFNDPLAHRIYAGSDFFLMPSRFEPCGLGQMIALHYGTLPVVRETGGLADTVRDAGRYADGNGFTFGPADAPSLVGAVRHAIGAWRDPSRRATLVERAMKEDHSWARAAERYEALYRDAIRSRE